MYSIQNNYNLKNVSPENFFSWAENQSSYLLHVIKY